MKTKLSINSRRHFLKNISYALGIFSVSSPLVSWSNTSSKAIRIKTLNLSLPESTILKQLFSISQKGIITDSISNSEVLYINQVAEADLWQIEQTAKANKHIIINSGNCDEGLQSQILNVCKACGVYMIAVDISQNKQAIFERATLFETTINQNIAISRAMSIIDLLATITTPSSFKVIKA